jgi:hypothetical protein
MAAPSVYSTLGILHVYFYPVKFNHPKIKKLTDNQMKFRLLQISILLGALLTTACLPKKDGTHHDHDTALSSQNDATQDTVKKSIPKEEHAQVGSAHVMIKYHAPAVRGRTIWGGLVPYGDVWVTGAHSATSIEFDKTVVIGEKEIAPGKYALFTIPEKAKWTIIINSKWDQHLADKYDQKDDIVRIEVTPEQLDKLQERLKYTVRSIDDNSGVVEISWEQIKVKLPFKVI